MSLSRQFQALLFFFLIIFFYEKILRAYKHSQGNINQQNKIKQTLNNKGNNFTLTQFSKRVKFACFPFWCFLCARNLFVKKCLLIVLITSLYYTSNLTILCYYIRTENMNDYKIVPGKNLTTTKKLKWKTQRLH